MKNNVRYFAKYYNFDENLYEHTQFYKSPYVCARDTYKHVVGNRTIDVYQYDVETGNTHLVLTNRDSATYYVFMGELERVSMCFNCSPWSNVAKIRETTYYRNGKICVRQRTIKN